MSLPDVTGDDVLVWVRQGRLVRCSRGVLGVPGLPDTVQGRAWKAIARCGPDARLGPRTSLGMMGVEGFAVAAETPLRTLRTAIDDAARRGKTSKGALRHRASELRATSGAGCSAGCSTDR